MPIERLSMAFFNLSVDTVTNIHRLPLQTNDIVASTSTTKTNSCHTKQLDKAISNLTITIIIINTYILMPADLANETDVFTV